MSRTTTQKTNLDGFPKAAEIIEISGGHELEAMDRAILNVLYQHAHDSGRLAEPDAEFEIELARLRPSKHESNDRMRAALLRLMRVIVTIPYVGAPTTDHPEGEPRVILTGLFDFFDMARDEKTLPTLVRYGLPKKLQPIIARSGRWGRIKAEVVCAMTSKYAIALYEIVQLRANLQKCVETIPIDRFRELMGVPPGKLLRGNHFVERVLETAALEVNGLSDIGVSIEPVRKSQRAPITGVTITWWRKEGDEYRNTLRELQRPKVGRMARLRGTVEEVEPPLAMTADATPETSPQPPLTVAQRVQTAREIGLKLLEIYAVLESVGPATLKGTLAEKQKVVEDMESACQQVAAITIPPETHSGEAWDEMRETLPVMQRVLAKALEEIRRTGVTELPSPSDPVGTP